jgi:hypothetical protein
MMGCHVGNDGLYMVMCVLEEEACCKSARNI